MWRFLLHREKVTATELGHPKLGLELRSDVEVLLFLSIKNLCFLVPVIWEKGESLRTNLSLTAPAESGQTWPSGRGEGWAFAWRGGWAFSRGEEDGHLVGRGGWAWRGEEDGHFGEENGHLEGEEDVWGERKMAFWEDEERAFGGRKMGIWEEEEDGHLGVTVSL